MAIYTYSSSNQRGWRGGQEGWNSQVNLGSIVCIHSETTEDPVTKSTQGKSMTIGFIKILKLNMLIQNAFSSEFEKSNSLHRLWSKIVPEEATE